MPKQLFFGGSRAEIRESYRDFKEKVGKTIGLHGFDYDNDRRLRRNAKLLRTETLMHHVYSILSEESAMRIKASNLREPDVTTTISAIINRDLISEEAASGTTERLLSLYIRLGEVPEFCTVESVSEPLPESEWEV